MPRAISIRLPEKSMITLSRIARAVNRPKAYLIRKAIGIYLAEYADYQIALDRFRDEADPILSNLHF